MRHDDPIHSRPTLEPLESRRLMSTSVFLGGECLPPPKPTPGGGGSSQPGQPTPTPTPNPTPGNDNDKDDDHNDNHQENEGGNGGNNNGEDGNNQGDGDTPAPIETVIPQVLGNWSGSHQASDKSASGQLSLHVSQTPGGTDDLTALLDFTGPQHLRWSGQLLYNARTGHLTMYYLSSALVAKLDATLVTPAGQSPTLVGTVEYFTRDGSYKATFSLLHSDTLPNP